jgi:hypothetical protein
MGGFKGKKKEDERGKKENEKPHHNLSSVNTLLANIWYCHPSPPALRN